MKRLLAIVMALCAAFAQAQAQTNYPNRSIRVIVPFPPGGPTDLLARLIADRLSTSLGQSFVVDNRPGATGTIGTAMLARAAPDGYTILMASTSSHIAAYMYRSVPYDVEKDVAPIIRTALLPFYFAVHPAVPATNMRELIALAKQKPGELSYASPGAGSGGHLCTENLRSLAGIDLLHIPFKGAAPGVAALVAGDVKMICDTLSTTHPQVRAGKLRGLAISGRHRMQAAPEIPTLTESGLADFDLSLWFGMFGTGGTPAPILARLNEEIGRILATPELQSRLTTMGGEAPSNSVEQFSEFLRADIPRWVKLIRDTGAKVE